MIYTNYTDALLITKFEWFKFIGRKDADLEEEVKRRGLIVEEEEKERTKSDFGSINDLLQY